MAEHVTHSTAKPELEHHGSGAYWIVYFALIALTGLTWWTGQMHLPNFGLILAIIIATTKATLVVLFFMHLWEQKGVNRITFVVTVSFVVLLLLGTFGDITTRLAMTLPPKEAPASELPKDAEKALEMPPAPGSRTGH